MEHVLFDEVSYYDAVSAREDSFQLEQFRTLDFASAMRGEIAKVITKSSNVHPRYVALVHKLCNDRAKQYVLRPTRKLRAGSPTGEEKLQDVYELSNLDWHLLQAHQKAEGQNAVVLLFEPWQPRRVRCHSFIFGEVEIDPGDLMNEDLRSAQRLTIRWPLKREGDTVIYGRRVYTPTEAWQEAPGSKERTSVFFPQDRGNLRNPLGFIPAVGARVVEAPHGWWWPRLPLDILSVQIGTIIGLADIENIVRIKSPGREVVVGEGARDAIKRARQAGPEGIIGLEGDSGLSYQAVSIDPRIDRYLQAIEVTLKLCAVYRDVNPDGLWASSGITGDAKEVEKEEILEARKRSELLWQGVEQQIVEVVGAIGAAGPRAVSVSAPRVQVDYHYVQARRNDLQTMQARVLACATGMDSALEIVERTENTPNRGYAEDLVKERLEAWRELLSSWKDESGVVQPPPGLDSIATQILSGSR